MIDEKRAPLSEEEIGKLLWLPPSRLMASPGQPRQNLEEGFIDDLALNVADLRRQKLGIDGSGFIAPVGARLPAGVFDASGAIIDRNFKLLVAGGETRWRAALMLAGEGVVDRREGGRGTLVRIEDILVPVIVSDMSEEQAYEVMYFENRKRRPIHPLDEGRALERIRQARGLSYRGLAAYIGEDLGYVQNRLYLYKAGQDVQDVAREKPAAMSSLRRIATVADGELRGELLQMVRDDAPTSAIARRLDEAKAAPAPKTRLPAQTPQNGHTVLASYDYQSSLQAAFAQTSACVRAARSESKEAFNPALRRELRQFIKLLENDLDALKTVLNEGVGE